MSIFQEAFDEAVEDALEALDEFASEYLGMERNQPMLRKQFTEALLSQDFEALMQQFVARHGQHEWDRQGQLALRRAAQAGLAEGEQL